MDDVKGSKGVDESDLSPSTDASSDQTPEPSQPSDESLREELAALIDNGRNYAQAEIAFQKTRAALAGRSIGIAAAAAIVAIILLHIAFLALAVGLVMALEPLVTIWGAIGIVFGGLLLLVALLGWIALKNGKKLGYLFSSADAEEEA